MRHLVATLLTISAWLTFCAAQQLEQKPTGPSALPILVAQTGHSRAIDRVSFSPDGLEILTQNESEVVIWDIASGRQIHKDNANMSVLRSAAFAVQGRSTGVLTAGNLNGEMTLGFSELGSWKALHLYGKSEWMKDLEHFDPPAPAKGRLSAGRWKEPPYPLLSESDILALSPDGSCLYSRSEITQNRAIRSTVGRDIYASWKEAVQQPAEARSEIQRSVLTTSADQKLALVSASMLNGLPDSAQLWDLATGEHLRQIGDPARRVTGLALSPNGRWALTVSAPLSTTADNRPDSSVHVWDTNTGKELHLLTGHAPKASIQRVPNWRAWQGDVYIWSVAFSPDNKLALTGGAPTAPRASGTLTLEKNRSKSMRVGKCSMPGSLRTVSSFSQAA